MKIYAIRDRLLDYFMQPFAGPDDKNVLAAVARTVNEQDNLSDIAQAPHHYEIWQLGEVDQEGHITATRALIADCSSLIRTGVRERPGADTRGSAPGGATRREQGSPGGALNGTLTQPGSVPDKGRTTDRQGEEAPQEH